MNGHSRQHCRAAGTPSLCDAGKRLHFVGIGGIGMSGLARLCHAQGLVLDGCDVKHNAMVKRLNHQGIHVWQGHDVRHLTPDVGCLVFSSAVPADEPEVVSARQRGIPVMSRGELLAELASTKRLVAVAGAHGKTTTSGMAAHALIEAGWDPTVVVGGNVLSLGGNVRAGGGIYMVAETDESDGSFTLLEPCVSIVTNIDREHLNYYQTFDHLVEAFQRFVWQMGPDGILIRCHDDPIVREQIHHPRQISYGFEPGADITAGAVRPNGYGSTFHALYEGRSLGEFQLAVPGRHNVLNALAIVSLGLALKIPITVIRDALAAFGGTSRRFQVLQLPGDVRLVDDYAHHPAEIHATLSADPFRGRRRVAVFEPHRYTRIKSLEEDFAQCFDEVDGVIVTDVYGAFEPPIPGISGERLASLIQAHGHPYVRYVPRKHLGAYLEQIAQAGDTFFFLGAGEISRVCHALAKRFHSRAGAAR